MQRLNNLFLVLHLFFCNICLLIADYETKNISENKIQEPSKAEKICMPYVFYAFIEILLYSKLFCDITWSLSYCLSIIIVVQFLGHSMSVHPDHDTHPHRFQWHFVFVLSIISFQVNYIYIFLNFGMSCQYSRLNLNRYVWQ